MSVGAVVIEVAQSFIQTNGPKFLPKHHEKSNLPNLSTIKHPIKSPSTVVSMYYITYKDIAGVLKEKSS
jgi:hypothetical protein